MITYTFILKDTNSQTSPVFLAIRGNGRRLKISTGLTVQTDAWDKDNFQMTRKSPFYKTENAVLLKWKNAAETAVREAELDNVSLEKTKERILAFLGKEVKNTPSSGKELFLPYFDRWATTDTTRRKATNLRFPVFWPDALPIKPYPGPNYKDFKNQSIVLRIHTRHTIVCPIAYSVSVGHPPAQYGR